MTKTVIFVGYIRQAYLDYFIERDYTIGLFQDPEKSDYAEKFEEDVDSHLDFVMPINFESDKSIELSLKGVRFKPNTLLICLNDRYLVNTAFMAQLLGLKQQKSFPLEMAKNVTDKIYQRKVFQQTYPEISPEYKKIRTFHAAYSFTRKYGFPVIVKPSNLSQSQLVNVCNDLEELISKVSYVLDHVAEVYKQNQIRRSPQVGIEQYIEGKQFSVDSYVSLDGKIVHTPICEQVIGYDIGMKSFETLYSTYTTGLSKKEQDKVFETITKSIEALKVHGNPTHTEVRITPEGDCKIVEVNIRTGGYRAEMLKHSYNINHVQNVINTYLGLPVEVSSKLIKHSTCPQFWPDKEGILKDIKGVDEVKKLASFQRISVSCKPGIKVGPASFGYPKLIYSVMAHEDKKTLMDDVKKMRELIKFEIQETKSEEDYV